MSEKLDPKQEAEAEETEKSSKPAEAEDKEKTKKTESESGGDDSQDGDSLVAKSFSDMKIKDDKNRNFFPGGKKMLIKANGVSYTTARVVGNGSFGVVFQATVVGTGEVVAIKKVLQDKRFKNRELQIMRLLNHPSVVKLLNSFYTNGDKVDEVYLNLVLEFVPETVYKISRQYSKMKQQMPILYVKLYMFQLCEALSYIHSLGICHRDIKPQNLLVDPQSCVLKLCDFGSAKILVKGEPNVSYICSRYYRAPELIFCSTNYTTAIDIWSMGCVMAELLLGHPLFPGDSAVDQLVEIIKVLGTPTREQIIEMNKNYIDYNFPFIKAHEWSKVFRAQTDPLAIELVSCFLHYTPFHRLLPNEAVSHPFFDELRDSTVRLPNGRNIPDMDYSAPPWKGETRT